MAANNFIQDTSMLEILFIFPVDSFKSLNNECVFHCKEELLCFARANIWIFMSNFDFISKFLFLKNIKPIVQIFIFTNKGSLSCVLVENWDLELHFKYKKTNKPKHKHAKYLANTFICKGPLFKDAPNGNAAVSDRNSRALSWQVRCNNPVPRNKISKPGSVFNVVMATVTQDILGTYNTVLGLFL